VKKCGEPIGGTTRQFLEYVGFFGGLGVVIVFLAASGSATTVIPCSANSWAAWS
jgi:hypothetical protein